MENIVMGVVITAAHVVGSVLAWLLVPWMQTPSVDTITWNKKNAITWNMTDDATKKDAMNKDHHWHVHFFEEIFAVASLLIGFIYLIWLTKFRKIKSTKKNEAGIKIDIKFYFQLTLLVAAVGQAFPSAQLSPHVLSYKVLMQTITIPEFLSRLGGGAIGLVIASVWCLFRVSYLVSIQSELDDEHDQHRHVYQLVDTPMHSTPMHSGSSRQMPAIRLSMQGSSYF